MMSRRRRRRRNGKKAVIAGAVIIAAFCVFAKVALPVITAKPAISIQGEQELEIAFNGEYKEQGATATLRDKNISSDVKTVGEVDTTKVGTYEIKYEVNYRNKQYTETRVVHVVDKEKPVLKLKGSRNVAVTDIEKYKEPGCKASDNCDGDLSKQVKTSMETVDEENYIVHYEVADSSGNKATAERKVTIDKDADNEMMGINPKNAIYLTFDDGPSSDVTERILDTLKKNDVKATFFIVDYDDSKKALVQRMVDEGHTVGIHGYSHVYSEIYKSPEAFMENINKLKEKVKKDTGYEPFELRFPGGSSNTVSADYCKGIMTKLSKVVTEAGWSYFDWNVDSTDAEGNNRPADVLYRNATQGLSKNRSNVILMHDTSAKQTTADMIQSLIDYGKSNGYSFYPISEDTVPVHHGINN